jgi:hypothetical protein
MPALPGLDDKEYWDTIIVWGQLYSDGCTGVPDFYRQACDEHDWHWRFGMTLYGEPITFDESNARFKAVIRAMARRNLGWNPKTWLNVFGFPMSRWRRVGVTTAGRHIWTAHRQRNLSPPYTLQPPESLW